MATMSPVPPLPVPMQVTAQRAGASAEHSHSQGPSSSVGPHETTNLRVANLPFSVQCTRTSPTFREGKTSTRSVLRSHCFQGSEISQVPDLPFRDSAHWRSDWMRYSTMAPAESSPTSQVPDAFRIPSAWEALVM